MSAEGVVKGRKEVQAVSKKVVEELVRRLAVKNVKKVGVLGIAATDYKAKLVKETVRKLAVEDVEKGCCLGIAAIAY